MTTRNLSCAAWRAAMLSASLLAASACTMADSASRVDTVVVVQAPGTDSASMQVAGGPTTTAPDSLAVAAARDSALIASQNGTLGGVPNGARDSAQVAPGRPTMPIADARIEVELGSRTLRLYRGNSLVATHPVAVGSPEWPTRTGEWNVTQVIFNPEWLPPDESWAEERKPRKPGDPENPLGQAQLVYDPPRSIHGTNDPKSIGKATSHGSIRVTNTVAKALARQLMEIVGVAKDEAWFKETQTRRTVKQVVDLPQWVPIKVY